jgi:hypothetical protein
VPFAAGFTGDAADFGLSRLRSEKYRGFVFATFNPEAPTLEEYLGPAASLIDRTVEMSPMGKVRLDAGWLKHRLRANWKMVVEGVVDGYHPDYVHTSLFRTVDYHFEAKGVESSTAPSPLARDWGGGHVEIDFAPTLKEQLAWFNVSPDRYPNYISAMKAAFGEQGAHERLIAGPSHALIFPNLLLAEMNIVIFEPIRVGETIQWNTPLLLDGVGEELNERIIRNGQAALGPGSFIIPDDAVMIERTQMAIEGRGRWIDLSRGLNRERVEDGIRVGVMYDDVAGRGFWRQHASLMAVSA